MNCPHCNESIDDALVLAARNSLIAKRPRPGARGLVRNPAGITEKLNRPAASLRELNRYLKHRLVRDRSGYYYWPDAIGLPNESDSIQYVYRHQQISIAEWIRRHDSVFGGKEVTE